MLHCKALKDMNRITEPKWTLAFLPQTGPFSSSQLEWFRHLTTLPL